MTLKGKYLSKLVDIGYKYNLKVNAWQKQQDYYTTYIFDGSVDYNDGVILSNREGIVELCQRCDPNVQLLIKLGWTY